MTSEINAYARLVSVLDTLAEMRRVRIKYHDTVSTNKTWNIR